MVYNLKPQADKVIMNYIQNNKEQAGLKPEYLQKYGDTETSLDNPEKTTTLVSTIVNGKVEDSLIFKKVFVGNNCHIKNSIILNDVYIGDNTYIENCIVESRNTIRANSRYVGDGEVKVLIEKTARYEVQ